MPKKAIVEKKKSLEKALDIAELEIIKGALRAQKERFETLQTKVAWAVVIAFIWLAVITF